MRDAACDLRLGSGLTANRKNLPDASELYPAFNWASRSSRPALCYRPLLAFSRSFCNGRVTELEPRTLHQPEKLKKLSKNDLVVLLLNLQSTKSTRVYLICFQLSAGRPQAGDRNLCNCDDGFAQGRRDAGFRNYGKKRARRWRCRAQRNACEYLAKAALDKPFREGASDRFGLTTLRQSHCRSDFRGSKAAVLT